MLFCRLRSAITTNPLSWRTDESYVPDSLSKGAVLYPFEKIYPEASDAQVYEGILWASKPRFRGSFFFTRKNFHVGDYNIYYMNVRGNAQQRVLEYLEEQAAVIDR